MIFRVLRLLRILRLLRMLKFKAAAEFKDLITTIIISLPS